MNYLNRNYYVEVKGKRSFVHPNENNMWRLPEDPKSLWTHYQVQNGLKIR